MKHTSRRLMHVGKVKSVISRCKKEGREIDEKKFIIEVMSKCNVARRTAREYIRVARYELGIK